MAQEDVEENAAALAKFPTRPRIMCPAVMLAASRNARVIGRTRSLTVSISTRKGFNHPGAPLGRRPAVNDLGEYRSPEISSDNQRQRARGRVMARCLEKPKAYGTKPIKFTRRSKRNRGVTIDTNPLIWAPWVRRV